MACLLWGLVRIFGFEWGQPLIALLTFTPYVAIVALVAGVVAVALRAWVEAAVAVAALGLLVLALAPRASGGPDPQFTSDAAISVLAFNMHLGDADAAEVVALVEEFDVDVACLSELTPDAVRRLDAAGIQKLLPETHLTPAGGAYGTGVYAAVEVRPLPGISPAVGETPMPRAEVDIEAPRALDVVCVHVRAPTDGAAAERWQEGLGAMPAGSEAGAQSWPATSTHPSTMRGSETWWIGTTQMPSEAGAGLSWTWPAADAMLPPVTIDHVLVDDALAVGSFTVEPVQGSDPPCGDR